MTEELYRRISAPFRTEARARAAARERSAHRTRLRRLPRPPHRAHADGTLRSAGSRRLGAGVAFAAVTLFRKAVNAPRPYETLGIDPLIEKDTAGRSFPSRHTFSLFMIAATWLVAQPGGRSRARRVRDRPRCRARHRRRALPTRCYRGRPRRRGRRTYRIHPRPLVKRSNILKEP